MLAVAARGNMNAMSATATASAPPSHIDDSVPRPVVRGTDIKVAQIASEYEHHGMTPDEIVEAHPHITLADVHAALTYFYDHRSAIVDDWRAGDALVAEMQKKYPGVLRARRAGHP